MRSGVPASVIDHESSSPDGRQTRIRKLGSVSSRREFLNMFVDKVRLVFEGSAPTVD